MLNYLVLLLLATQNLELMFEILHRLENKNRLVWFGHSKMFDILAQIELKTAVFFLKTRNLEKRITKSFKCIKGDQWCYKTGT